MRNELMTIRVDQSELTGQHYIHFIDHSGTTCDNNGCWTDIEIDEATYNALRKICYPMWDGTYKKFRYGNERDCFRNCDHPCENSVMKRIDELLDKLKGGDT